MATVPESDYVCISKSDLRLVFVNKKTYKGDLPHVYATKDLPNAVYTCIYSSKDKIIFENCTKHLRIRSKTPYCDTIDPSEDKPTNANVPRVYAYRGTKSNGDHDWEQIYPGKVVDDKPVVHSPKKVVIERDLDFYYHEIPGNQERAKLNAKYGGQYVVGEKWTNHYHQCGQGYYGVDNYRDFMNSGKRDDVTPVWKQLVGWLGLGPSLRDKFTNHSQVKEITYLRLVLRRRGDCGCQWDGGFPLSLRGNKIKSHFSKTKDNPIGNWVGKTVNYGVLKSPVDKGVKGTHDSTYNIEINLKTKDGQKVAELFKKWLRGTDGCNSILLFTDTRSGSWRKENSKLKYGHGYWSKNYYKIFSFELEIKYTT